MKNLIILITFIFSIGSSVIAKDIEIHLSYKIILNPIDETRPFFVIDATIAETVRQMNELLDSFERGYRFSLTEILEVGGVSGNPENPSVWYNTNFLDSADSTDWKNQFEDMAKSNTAYKWSNNAINIYINAATMGGICSFPSEDEVIVIGANSYSSSMVTLHEIGHYFNLMHTHGNCSCSEGKCCPDNETGNDNLNDTFSDNACWDSLDKASQFHYNQIFNSPSLSPQQKTNIESIFLNIMSYHNFGNSCNGYVSGFNPNNLSEMQLDVWADVMDEHSSRRNVRSGDSWFVKPSGSNGDGTAKNPFDLIFHGLNAINPQGGDVIYLREGNHSNIPDVIKKPVTIRATRKGSAIIGQ